MKADRLLNALTQQELAQLIDAFLTVLPLESQEEAIAQLSEATQQTVRQILTSDSATEPNPVSATQTASPAKQAQTWTELWQRWDEVIGEAAEDDGEYVIQEVHWEPPYFDTDHFVEDLEKIAVQMQPLLQTAFEQEFQPDRGFASALLEAEAEISSGLEDWMEITEGIELGRSLTNCLLQWEWLAVQQQEQNAFQLAQRIREYELQFQEIELQSDTVFNFCTQLPESEQRCLLAGFTENREVSFWQKTLGDTSSHWHEIYLHLIEEYAPDRYLDNLRKTIPQQWENGLPIIEALLAEQNYAESLAVIKETFDSLLISTQGKANWTPEATLLIAISGFYYEGQQTSAGQLLRHYQQTAQGLGQTDRANALEIQQIAMVQWSDWSVMFKAFADVPLAKPTRHALLASWRNLVDRRTKPQSWGGYGSGQPVNGWWVLWLIDSIADPDKGANWFQQQIVQWLTQLPGNQQQLGENYALLRLLTADLTELQNQGKSDFPQFYQTVIRPQEFSRANYRTRRDYLKQYAPADLLDQVMHYWKTHLHNFVPKPEFASKSDYTAHAKWMGALKEVSPESYETLLTQWRSDHHRRSNLWKAMKQVGLD